MKRVTVVCACLALAASCVMAPESRFGDETADVELTGPSLSVWPAAAVAKDANFDFDYETKCWRDDPGVPFHVMKTHVRLRYDPATLTFLWVEVTNAGAGHAYRHVCLTPAPDGRFTIRMRTIFDGREQDLTAVRIHGPDPATWSCDEYGIGPKDSLIEGIEVLYEPDGAFKVVPARSGYLATRDIHIHREMTGSVRATDRDVLDLP